MSRSRRHRGATRQEVTVLVVDRQRMSCDTTPRIAERLGARKKPRLDHVGLPEMRCRFIRDRRTIEGSRVATRCATPVGDARNRKVSGRSTSKDVAGVEAHLDRIGLVNIGQGFTRKPRTMAEKGSATLRVARHWAAQLDIEARDPAVKRIRSPSRLMHLQKELRAGLFVTGERLSGNAARGEA